MDLSKITCENYAKFVTYYKLMQECSPAILGHAGLCLVSDIYKGNNVYDGFLKAYQGLSYEYECAKYANIDWSELSFFELVQEIVHYNIKLTDACCAHFGRSIFGQTQREINARFNELSSLFEQINSNTGSTIPYYMSGEKNFEPVRKSLKTIEEESLSDFYKSFYSFGLNPEQDSVFEWLFKIEQNQKESLKKIQ